MSNYLYGSLCRISDLETSDFTVTPIAHDNWDTGDYVVGTVSSRPSHEARIESPSGRSIEPLEGEQIVGAFGKRCATLGKVGDWRDINPDAGDMEVIGGGGVIGKATSTSPFAPETIPLRYDGHVQLNGSKATMSQYVGESDSADVSKPVVLVLGTSMSSGKTMSARVIVRALVELGMTVSGCKLTGSGRYHDVLSMKDAGAKNVYDFVDAGLPTTVVPEENFRSSLRCLLPELQEDPSDVLVVEIGASPLEPYNGEVVIELLRDNVVFTALTASDPYAVVGFNTKVDVPVDLVSGIATNTSAGVELIEELTGLPALNLQQEETMKQLHAMLEESLSEN